MRLLSDSIEDFIKALMEDEQDQQQAIELRRNELAEHFQCAPSQINYVLATRFTPDHGYVIESRRGGGGYIRIMRLASTSREELLQSLYQRIGMSISSADAMKIVDHLESEKIVSSDEAKLMKAALSPQAVPLPLTMKDALCAGTLRSMILALAKRCPNGCPVRAGKEVYPIVECSQCFYPRRDESLGSGADQRGLDGARKDGQRTLALRSVPRR